MTPNRPNLLLSSGSHHSDHDQPTRDHPQPAWHDNKRVKLIFATAVKKGQTSAHELLQSKHRPGDRLQKTSSSKLVIVSTSPHKDSHRLAPWKPVKEQPGPAESRWLTALNLLRRIRKAFGNSCEVHQHWSPLLLHKNPDLCIIVVVRHGAQFCPPFPPTISPPTFPSRFPLNTFPMLLCLNMSCPFDFLHLAPAHLTIHLNLIIRFLFSSNRIPIFRMIYNFAIAFTLSVLFLAPFSLPARHPLQVALFPLNISNPLCSLHLQHCFFSTSSTTTSQHAIPCFLVCTCFDQVLFLLHSHP